MNTSKVFNKFLQLQEDTISVDQLKEMLYDNYELFYIWGRTEGKTKPARSFSRAEAYSIAGPGGLAMGGARYWTNRYVPEGYVILFDTSRGGFRTFPIHRITRIEKDGQTFKVR